MHQPKLTQLGPRAKRLLTLLALFLLAAAITLANRSWSKYYTGSWDGYSELLAVGRVTQLQQGQSAPGGFLGVYTQEWGDGEGYQLLKQNPPQDPADYHSYPHQSGLQGLLQGLLARLLLHTPADGELRLNALYFCNCLLFYALCLTLCLALGRHFGPLTGLGALAALLLAPWLTTGAKNMYWVLWTWLLPCGAAVGQCAFWRAHGRFGRRWLAAAFFAVLVRCLCGFEYISTLLILCEAPLALGWVEQAGARRPWFWQMVRTGLAALAGAATALAVWLAQAAAYYGSFAQALAEVLSTAGARAGAAALEGDAASALTAQLSAGQVAAQFLWDGTPMLQLGPATVTLPVLLALAGLALALGLLPWLLRGGLRKKDLRPLALAALWLLCLLAPLSWMVLAKGHAALHTHLTPMLWHFGLVPATLALLGFWLERGGRALGQKFAKREDRA